MKRCFLQICLEIYICSIFQKIFNNVFLPISRSKHQRGISMFYLCVYINAALQKSFDFINFPIGCSLNKIVSQIFIL